MLKRQILFIGILFTCFIVAPAIADDIDIYGTTGISLEPNVLIIFDNSGSMRRSIKIPAEEYDPNTDYALAGGDNKERYAVYYEKCVEVACSVECTWTKVTDHVDNIHCDIVREMLKTKGWVSNEPFNIDSFECSGSEQKLRIGNFMNYENNPVSDGQEKPKYVIAKKAISNLIENTENVRFGLMHFNSNHEGGYVKYKCGTDKDILYNYITGMDADDFNTNTPLAETLAEAGLYFSGKTSWFTSDTYSTTEPVQEVCQKNYIIIMTDGEPTQDSNIKLQSGQYIIPGKCIVPGCNTLAKLDDVSQFLYDNDIHTSGDGASYEKQNIITHTIGFATDQVLLSNTAQKGGGDYYYANSLSGLEAAFEQIINSITEANAVFAAPVVPVNRVKRTYGGEWIYLSYFRPQQSGEWLGNIKKYLLGNGKKITLPSGQSFTPEKGVLYDRNGNDVEDDGVIKDNACSFWTTICNDGNDVIKGGVGEKLNSNNSRNLYYYKTGAGETKDLWASQNHFKVDNDVPLSNTVISKAHNLTNGWKMGAIIHSEPALVHYSSTQTIIYSGANDGMLHCFDETNGEELWGFIPHGQINKLSNLGDGNRDYYVDGTPVVSYGELMSGNTQLFKPETLIFGERRGGYRYYALNISDYSKPKYLYSIEPNILGEGKSLGQSWCTPKICTISTETITIGDKKIVNKNKLKKVFIIAGGYDPNQDNLTPNASDSLGKSIFSVTTSNGLLSKLNINHTNFSAMNHCIVDVKTVAAFTDSCGNEITTRLYAGDMGGKIFIFADDVEYATINEKIVTQTRTPDGTFPVKKLLFDTEGRKIFHAPAVAGIEKTSEEWVVFGTGDKEHPGLIEDPGHENYFYAIRNNWIRESLTINDLKNLTTNTIDLSIDSTSSEAKEFKADLESKAGWYIKLPNSGEKVTSSPVVANGYIYFTTYTPASPDDAGATQDDPCAGSGAVGTGRVYSIRLTDAVATYDLDKDGTLKPKDRAKKTKTPPPPPTDTGDNIIIWPEVLKVPNSISSNYYFWRQN